MKSKSSSQSVLICLFAALTFAVCISPALGQCEPTTTWTGTSGDWFTDGNWSDHVPCSTTDAYINDAGTAQINSSGASAGSLTLGQYSSNSGAVTIDGTNGGQLVPSGNIYVGYQGTGSLSITNGGNVENPTGVTGSGYIAASTSSSAASNGSVTVTGSGSTWQIGNIDTLYSVLFVGGNETNDGGTALLSITDGGTVTVQNNGDESAATVGPSGTLTGNGTLDTSSSSTPETDVYGTLAPNWTLTIGGNLSLESIATTSCNVTPGNLGSVDVSVSGTATLNGRLSVTMTGTFTAGTQFTLLHADGGRLSDSKFSSTSITYSPVPTYKPVITYDAHNVYLYLKPN